MNKINYFIENTRRNYMYKNVQHIFLHQGAVYINIYIYVLYT